MFAIVHFCLIFFTFILVSLSSGKLFFLQSYSTSLFFAVAIALFSILHNLLKKLFYSPRASNIPRNEKIWIFPVLSIFSSLLLMISIFYLPSLLDRAFWSRTLSVPTLYFAQIVNMMIVILFFSVFFFSMSVFFWSRKISNDYGTEGKKWKVIKTGIFITLFGFLSGLLFYVASYKKSNILFSFANIYSFRGNIPRAERIYRQIQELGNKGIVDESTLFRLFNLAYICNDKKKMKEYYKRLSEVYPRSTFLDDASYGFLKYNSFSEKGCDAFLQRFRYSPWHDDVMIRQYLNYRKNNHLEKASKLSRRIQNLPWYENVIIQNKKHIVSYSTSEYFTMMKNKLHK